MMEPMTICPNCGAELEIGSWPFCPHGSIYAQTAQHFDPIVVHRASDGTYSFPVSVDAPVRPGNEKVEIRTLREADRITREVNQLEDARLHEAHAHSENLRDQTLRRNRAAMDRLKEHFTARGREFADGARAYVDSKRRPSPGSANFHIDVFSNDASNRDAHVDARTGWRSHKA